MEVEDEFGDGVGDEFDDDDGNDGEDEDVTTNVNRLQVSFVVLLPPVHLYPFSTMHLSDHPSPETTLPSSHSSSLSLLLLPHKYMH